MQESQGHREERQRREAGFTAVDITVALALASILAGATYNTLSQSLPRWRVRQAALDVAGALRSARAEAVMEREVITAPFNVDEGTYVAVEAEPSGSTGASGTPVPERTKRRVVRLPRGVAFRVPPADDTRNSLADPITLDPPGTVDDAGEFDVRGRLRSELYPAFVHVGDDHVGAYRRVSVDLAGNIQIQVWNDEHGWTR